MSFNEAQTSVLAHTRGPLLVVAGPGTGKTRTLTEKAASFLRTEGVSPEHLTILTFSTKAVAELEHRLSEHHTNLPHILTFHALAYRLVSANTSKTPRIISSEYKRKLLREVAQSDEYRPSPKDLDLAFTRNRSSLDAYIAYPQAFNAYRTRLTRKGLTDFDELLEQAVAHLSLHLPFRERIQNQIQWLLIDEFQDTNTMQNEMVALLGEKAEHVCAIGDPHQAIYGFRGSRPDAFDLFRHYFPNTQTLTLSTSYRSTPEILTPATRLFTETPYIQSHTSRGETPYIIHCASEHQEGKYIAREIRRLMGGLDLNEYSYEESPYRFSDFAILYRSHEIGSKLDQHLRKHSIPTSRTGEKPFSEHPEIKRTLQHLDQTPTNHTESLSNVLDRAITETIEAKHLHKNTLKAHEQKNRLSFLAQTAQRWDHMTFAEAYNHLRSFIHYLDKDQPPLDGDRVHLMTIHGAKGLEFPVVFVAGLEEGLLPFISSNEESDIEEERRLLYVAMTRAQEKLYLSYAASRTIYGTSSSRRPSRFLNAIPPEHVTYSHTGFTSQAPSSSSDSSPSSQNSLF